MWYFLAASDDGASVFIPKGMSAIADLALTLSKDVSPAIQMLPKRVWPAVQSFLDGQDVVIHGAFSDYAPFLARLIGIVRYIPSEYRDTQDLEWWNRRIRDQTNALKAFVRSALDVAKKTLNSDLGERGVSIEELAVEFIAIEELLTYGDYFPRHPVLRRIPTVEPERKPKDDSPICTKVAKGTTRLWELVFSCGGALTAVTA